MQMLRKPNPDKDKINMILISLKFDKTHTHHLKFVLFIFEYFHYFRIFIMPIYIFFRIF